MIPITLKIIGDSAVEWPGHRITGSASRLFGLVLLLTLDGGKPQSRRGLETLLFDEDVSEQEGAHSLRQLIYRLRKQGLCVDDQSGLLTLGDARIIPSIEALVALSARERSALSPRELTPFPGWFPRLPSAFQEWLDRQRDTIACTIASLLSADLEESRLRGDWDSVVKLASLQEALRTPHHADPCARPEALFMLGRQGQALDAIEQALALPHSESTRQALRTLRSRISRSSSRVSSLPLRGREQAITTLHREWSEAQKDGPRLVRIVGAPGIGKSRLADDFATIARLRGAGTLHYRCDATASNYPLSLFAHVLPELRSKRGSLGAAPRHWDILDRLRPSASNSDVADHEGVAPERIRAAIRDALVDVVSAVAEEMPLLFVIDDAHFLDAHSVAVLHDLASRSHARVLIIACCRPQDSAHALLTPGPRASTLALAPLNTADSRALLMDLTQHLLWPAQHFDDCLRQAAGIPFYLLALYQHSHTADSPFNVPVDIASLAAGSYYSLDCDSKTVLESCILMGRLATLERTRRVAMLDEQHLLTSLRTLEDRGLITAQDGQLQGPHALLHDAITRLVPHSVIAVLNGRVAAVFTSDAADDPDDVPLALAAANAWIAAGNQSNALALMRTSAFRIASAGEPAAAAELLYQLVPRLPESADRMALLFDVAQLAQAGGVPALVCTCWETSIALARALSLDDALLQDLELRLLEAKAFEETTQYVAVPALTQFTESPSASDATRCKAMMLMLINADACYDRAMANQVYANLARFASHEPDGLLQSCRLVFHTSFGDVSEAYGIMDGLIAKFDVPSASESVSRSRMHAVYSANRLMRLNWARDIARQDYRFHDKRGDRSTAMWWASILNDIEISDGDFDAANYWLGETRRQLRHQGAAKMHAGSGIHSSAATLAILEGRYDEAEEILGEADRSNKRLVNDRYFAVNTALRVRIQVRRGDSRLSDTLLGQLETLYDRGRCLSGQDTIAEMLWCSRIHAGKAAEATQLLQDYLTVFRREREMPEWNIRHTTGADEAWTRTPWAKVPPIALTRTATPTP